MKINQKKLQVYRKTQMRQIFCTKKATYDIVVAQFLIEQNNKVAEVVSVDVLAEACGFTSRPIKEEDGYLFFQNPLTSAKVVIDHEHIQKELDFTQPLIFANGELIDGHHRLYRAFMLGVETLTAYTLTAMEAKLC